MKKAIRMWIARDGGLYDEDTNRIKTGELHLFYDTPLPSIDTETRAVKFEGARCIGTIPSYMYPWIEDGFCYEISDDKANYRKELQNFSRKVIETLKSCRDNWPYFQTIAEEKMNNNIEDLIKLAENNLKQL